MDKPQITPGQNGYLAPLEQTNWKNPWTDIAQADSGIAQAGVTQGQQDLAGLQSQMQSYSQQSSPYPSYPNAGGLGSQQAFGPSQPAPAVAGSSTNPWSFQGEANAR